MQQMLKKNVPIPKVRKYDSEQQGLFYLHFGCEAYYFTMKTNWISKITCY